MVGPPEERPSPLGPGDDVGLSYNERINLTYPSQAASQNPITLGGSVIRNVASWWQTTAPPIAGARSDTGGPRSSLR